MAETELKDLDIENERMKKLKLFLIQKTKQIKMR